MARSVLTPVVLVRDGSVADGAGAAIAGLVSGGAYVADPPGPNGIKFRVANSDTAAHNVTVRAGGSGVTASGAANPGVPFEGATVGDLVVQVPASSTLNIGPLTSDRFT